MAGADDRSVTTDRKYGIDKLGPQQSILRSAITRLLKAANELLEAPSPSSHDLQEAIDVLESKDLALYETEKRIIERLHRDEVEPDYFDALASEDTYAVP